jgi:hypothetical protein
MSTTPLQFWLLTGEVPSGPFTLEQIHDELASGRATWNTPACVVGGNEWRPLVQTPGVGPTASAQPGDSSPLPTSHSPSLQSISEIASPTPIVPANTDRTAERVGLFVGISLLIGAVALVGWLGYLVYNWVRPYTPMEVCVKDQTPDDPNLTFEWTRESDGPAAGVKLVGFRMSIWVPEAGRRVPMEGNIRLIQSSGWKADDLVISGVEGVAMDGPVSLIDELQREPLLKAGNKKATPSNLTPPAVQRKGIAGAFDYVWNNFGCGGILIVVVVIAIVMGVIEELKKKQS